MSFTTTLAIGAGLLAGWVDYRFAERRPESIVRRMVHVAVAYVLLQAAIFAGRHLGGSGAGDLRLLSAVFLVILPAFVYVFLTCMWLVRTLADVVGVARR